MHNFYGKQKKLKLKVGSAYVVQQRILNKGGISLYTYNIVHNDYGLGLTVDVKRPWFKAIKSQSEVLIYLGKLSEIVEEKLGISHDYPMFLDVNTGKTVTVTNTVAGSPNMFFEPI